MDRKNYELIVFDLDGTLLDTSPGIFNSVRYAQQQMGFPSLSESRLSEFVGPPPKQMYQQVFGVNEEEAAKATAFHRQYSAEKAIYEATVYPGMKQTLSVLKQSGYRLAVATLKGQKIAETVLQLYGLRDYFDAVVGMDEAESHTKCATIQLAIVLTGTTGAVLMVGDSEYDAEGAAQAGVDFVGAIYGYGISEDEARFPLIRNPEQLLLQL